ncbi:MAG TPA: PepSY-associated TM helix domain-containing protein [Pyrinomonadaceae bacterium]|nr:PepSY-associated TM helix domain-containing protein [Pyrinomonadaceae bacterium]
MKKLRKIIFWCHLPVGVTAGLVILTMCVTGVVLSFEKQITSWADTRSYRAAPPAPETKHLPVETLLAKARDSRGATPTAVTVKSDPAAPAEIAFGREASLFVNPYSGAILGEGSRKVRGFFRAVTDWHRWLGAKGDNRNVARAITGACNLGFLFLVMSGFYLWWPRNWNLKALRNVTWFRRGLPSRARDFNWHNVIGFWSAGPLFIVVISAVVISYTWAGNLVYRIVGETPPAPRANQPAAPSGANKETVSPIDNLNSAWVRAEQQVSDWRSVSLQLPVSASAPLTFNIDRGNGGQPQKRAQLVLDRATGDVVRWEPFSSYTRGRQLRSILRFAHTGEVVGIPGQVVAGLVSMGGAFLVITGLALAFRRLLGWRARRRAIPAASNAILTPITRRESGAFDLQRNVNLDGR